jgi:uncharacterized protein YoxC
MAISPELLEEITRLIDERVRDIKVQREDFDALREAVRDLAEAQARTEERMGRLEAAVERLAEAQARTEERMGRLEAAMERLAEAQARTEQRLEALAEAQARTEHGLSELSQTVKGLAEAQAKTESGLDALSQTVKQLAKSVENLAQQVGRLSDNVGFGLEDVARVMLPGYLWRHYGIVLEHELDRRFFRVDKTEVEINLYGEGKRDGEDIIVLGECKSRIYQREVEKFVEALSLLGNRLDKKIFKVMFGFYLHPSADTPAQLNDITLVASYHR